MNLQAMKSTATLAAGKTKLALKAKSPEILIGVGIVSAIGATVLACRATLHVEEVIDNAKFNMDTCKGEVTVRANAGEEHVYNESHLKKDLTIIYVQTGVELAKLYAPAVLLGGLSITSILSGYNILNKRNVALAAAYTALEETFRDYRNRVIDRYGEEVEKQIYNNTHYEKISITGEDGKKKKEQVEVAGPGNMYSFRFDHKNINWNTTTDYNMMYLKNQEQYANDMFNARGHIFLNEILDLLGIDRVDYGQLVGWKVGNGDNYVDFGTSVVLEPVKEGSEVLQEVFMLNFNVDGETWSQI